ncbi:MAG: methyltransferase domain-containing protein [Myxococcales bacterium]|nr:methyltransferase domain-containing protein [Myxococcota bacterium]MDW8282511.1 methyltransferase domain-containing protein [Myxococcales bacterium]
MHPDTPTLLPLVCPVCRVRNECGRQMYTLSLRAALRTTEDGQVLQGVLGCDNPACQRSYPIVDGIPVVVADLAAWLTGQIVHVVEGELHPELQALLAGAGPDDAVYARLCEHLSIYLDAHWGDRAQPPPVPPGFPVSPFGFAAPAERLAERASVPVERAVDLGCSVGRGVAELARGARICVGVDLHLGALRRARRLLSGERLAYGRRTIGRHYRTAIAVAGDLAMPATFICADVLDPPLVPGSFDRVAALGVLDSVRAPVQLLSVLDGLCRPGGEVLLGSPYAWQSGIVEEQGRLGDADPAADLRRRLESGDGLEASYIIEEEADLPWWLRRDDRSAQAYILHYLRARKLEKVLGPPFGFP